MSKLAGLYKTEMDAVAAIANALGHLLSSHVSCTGYSFPEEVIELANLELNMHGLEAYLDEANLVKYRNVDAEAP